MKNLIARFVKDESGATAIEYGLIAAGISLAIIAVVNGIRDIGAFESQGFTFSTTSGSGQTANVSNAFTNPLTNSYKRLIPGFEAPVLLAYSSRNRSASCRIPFSASPKGKRIEVRFPDPGANPYLAYASLLMAGLDGIENKIHPGDPMDKDLYALPPEELKEVPTVCGSLRQALECLDHDRAFLKKGGVFSDDFIDSYIELKMQEVHAFEHTPHPVEFKMYYSV